MRQESSMPGALRVSPLVKTTFGAALTLAVLLSLFDVLGAVGRAPGRGDITDFHAFYIVGKLIWSSDIEGAYQASTMLAQEQAWGDRSAQSLGLLVNPLAERHPILTLSPIGPVSFGLFWLILQPLWEAGARDGAGAPTPFSIPEPNGEGAPA